MKGNLFKKISAAILALCLCAGLSLQISGTAQAADGQIISVSADDIKDTGARKAINNAISEARDIQEENGGIVTIRVAPGAYTLSHSINLYSNITLDLTGVTLTRSGSDNVIHAGPNESSTSGVSGYYYENITIRGGSLNCNGGSATGIKVAHLKNFRMEGVTVENTRNGHLMEIAACDGLTLKNCTFRDQISAKKTNRYEAVQLDVIAKKHFNNYLSEALPMKNITVTGCTFQNVPRGIGSHTAILNAPFSNINITGNTFKDCKSCAIQACYWYDANISNNTVTGSPRGIILYSVNSSGSKNSSYGTFPASYFESIGGVKHDISNSYVTPAKNQKIIISNNMITLNNKKDPYANFEKMGILVGGVKVTNSKKTYSDKSGNIPKGTYYISGVTISGNKITTGGHGIRLQYVRNAKVKNNTISRTSGSKVSGTYGIHITYGTRGIDVTGNTVKKNFNKGIAANRKARLGSISKNKVYSAKQRGITLEKAYAKKINGNKIYGAGTFGISLTLGSTANQLKNNRCKKCRSKKINIASNCRVKKKSGNK